MSKKPDGGFIPLDTNVIYRCGWCGHPTNKNGKPLKVDPEKYIEKHIGRKVINTQGYCCQEEQQERQRIQITH